MLVETKQTATIVMMMIWRNILFGVLNNKPQPTANTPTTSPRTTTYISNNNP
jgi:hypothetical protein